MTTAGHFVGTLDYTAPEVIQGGDADARSDVYSLGCALYFVLTRVSPFLRDSHVATMFAHVNEPPPSLLAARPDLPPAIAPVIARALAKDPAARPQTAGEFAREAQDALSAAASTATAEPEERPRRRARLPRSLLTAIVGLGLIAAAVAVFTGNDGKQPAAAATATPRASVPKVVASIEAGKGPDGISVSDDGQVWVTDARAGTANRIDTETNTVESNPDPVVVGTIRSAISRTASRSASSSCG
jgi:serine/threonine protein kinase